MAGGEEIHLHGRVDASHQSGSYGFATAAIRGTDKADEDIHFTCHLDHPRPGANDNASGCVSILETARTLNALISEGILPQPSRSIRFLWPAEIEGSIVIRFRFGGYTGCYTGRIGSYTRKQEHSADKRRICRPSFYP